MSDRQLQSLLRGARQGQVALTDYVAAALRAKSVEEVVGDLDGFDVGDIRLAVTQVWVPVYAAQSTLHKDRVELAGVLGNLIAKRVAPSRRRNRFPTLPFILRNQSLLSEADWRLFAVECATGVLHRWDSSYIDNTDLPRHAIRTTRLYLRGEVTKQELVDAGDDVFAALRSDEYRADYLTRPAAWSALRSAAWAASRSTALAVSKTVECAARSAAEDAEGDPAEVKRQLARMSARLSDYLLGLSALPWQV